VDLWDLTKLLFRRWYFALPLLLVTIATVYLTAQTVKPDYRGLGYLQMIPPPGSTQPQNPNAKPRPHNPWLDLGYEALGTAVLLKVTGKETLERFANSGLTDNVAVELSRNGTLFEIEAVGNAPEQVTATIREVIRLLSAQIATSQQEYRVLPEDTITTNVVNDGGNIEVVTTKQKRVLIVAAGLGVLLTAAATIGLDALLRRLRRQRYGRVDVGLDPHRLSPPVPPVTRMPNLAPPPNPPPPRPGWRDRAAPAPIPGPVLSLPPGVGHERPRVTYETVDPVASAPRTYPESEDRRRTDPYLVPRNDAPAPAADGPAETTGRTDADGDVTIVLPLAYLSKRDDRNSKG
jgi:hypothetical protein